MVFESLVADLLNKYLGEYVDNLDRSQLKIGIWGGDVVLKDLSLKQSALDDLQLPVKTVNGFLGKLTLKIPWKNLYSAPVEASVEDLYLLVVPNTEITYDPVKEEKWKQEAKQAEINKVEEAKKKEREKGKPKPDDTFTEKLATQIVRNVQISIKNIHIRYEDRVNTNGSPFALGMTLSSLVVTTTDKGWVPKISQDMTAMIYKVLTIEGLSIYWNARTPVSFLRLSQVELYEAFKESIASKDTLVMNYQYMLGPINASSQLRINSKPESDGSQFTTPKVLLNLKLATLKVKISKAQYQDLMVLLDSMDRMVRAAPYRKYRPNVSTYKGNYSKWWKYAYICVLEEEVKRRKRNWDWLNIRTHRQICKDYAKAYQQKMTLAKPPADVVNTCQQCERALDVLNIVLIRQKIEVEVERRGLLEQQKQKQAGWFSGWWGGGSKEDDSAKNNIMKQFEEAMTGSEKEKLYRAIGYQENTAPAEYPVEFVAMDLNFVLKSLEVEVSDETYKVLAGTIKNVKARLEQRPAGQALKVTVSMEQFLITGMQQKQILPQLVQTQMDIPAITMKLVPLPLLDVVFEINPLDGLCDQRVHITSRPLHLIYDAMTINKIIDVFTVEQNAVITQLQTAANTKIAEIKEKSALGLQYAIQKHTRLDLKIDLMGFYAVLPHGGLYTGKDQALFLVNLGRMLFNSKTRSVDDVNVHKMHREGSTEIEIMKEMLNRSYDRFVIEIKEAQVKMVLPGEPWKMEHDATSDQYLIKPLNLKINLSKSLFPDDHRLPRLKVDAKLPSINLKVAETRLLNLIALFVSIPFPESKSEETEIGGALYSSQTSLSVMEIARATNIREKKKAPTQTEEQVVQYTELEAKFELNEVTVALFRKRKEGDIPLGDFRVLSLEAEMIQQTYNLNVNLRLGGVSLHQDYEGEMINVINTPMAEGKKDYLFVLSFCKVNKLSPEFHSKYGSVVQLLEMDFSRLDVLVHQEALLDAIHWANKLQGYLANATAAKAKTTAPGGLGSKASRPTTPIKQLRSNKFLILDTIREEGNTRLPRRSTRTLVDTIDLKLRANLGEISLTLQNSLRMVGRMLIKGGESAVIMKRSYTQVDAKLSNFEFIDLRTNTNHQKVLSIVGGEEALTSQIVMFNTDANRETDHINMSITANIACFRVVFLNYFVMSLVDFLNKFSAAQAAIIEASAAAAEVAKANMQQAYQEAFRVRLNIQLKAPIILVPANSMSTDAVLLDFGVLTMVNTFQELHVVKDEQELTAVIDNLHLELQNLKVSRVKLGSSMEVAIECLLLQPISFQLVVQRNLSADWFTSSPDLDVSGRLESIHVKLSQEDYNMIMAVVSQNLAEVPPATQIRPPSTDSAIVEDVKPVLGSKTNVDKTKLKTTEVEVPLHVEEKPQETARATIKFNFTLESLVVDLFKGGAKEIVANTCPMRGHGLARFTLYVLSLKGALLSDSSLTTSVLLLDCLMDDTRHTQVGKINRYMERKPDDTKKRSMIDVTFQQKLNTSFVDMRVYSFILILNMDHLMTLSEFFTGHQSQTTPPLAPQKSSRMNAPQVSGMPTLNQMKDAASSQFDQTIITVSLKVEQPDIILVENMDDINANAIIMNNEVNLKFRMQGSHYFVSGSLKDLQLFSCCFNPERRRDTKAQILRPVSVNVQGSTPPGQGLHIDVNTTNLRLAVSPGTIELLTRAITTITRGKSDSEENTEEEEDFSTLWETEPFIETNYWFLKTELAEDASESIALMEASPKLDEICLVTVPSLVITLEAGVGSKTLPMLLLDSNMQANARNWSSKLSVDGTMSLQMSYYNSRLALWEPLVEPIEVTKPGGPPVHVPWEINLQIESNDPRRSFDVDEDSITEIMNAKPKMVYSVSSKDIMEVTVTRTCVEVLKNLATAFNNAIYKPEMTTTKASAPYVVQNDLGSAVTVILTEGIFKVFDPEGQKTEVSEVVLETGAKVDLCLVEEEDIQIVRTSVVKEKYLQIKVPERQCELDLPIARADKRYFSLQHRGAGNDPWGLVSDVQVQGGATVINLRGIIQVRNHFEIPVSVYFMTKKGNEVELVGTVEPHKHLNLPLEAIYTPTNELFFSVEGFTVSLSPFVWKDLQKSLAMTKVLQCNAKNIEDKEPFFFKAVGELEQVYHELSNRHTMASTCYNIHLRPTVILKNFLPVDMMVCTQGTIVEKTLTPGQRMQIPTAEPGASTIVIRIDYLEKMWSCKHEIAASPPELSVWTFQSYDCPQRITLDLGMHCVNENGSLKLALYCPFWMINKTGLMLSYRQSDDSSNVLYHPPHFKGPIMFSFRAKVFFGKKKSCIKVEGGDWSDKFSLDVAGSSGVINCRVDKMVYEIGVHIQLTYNSLTKQVTFTPYHVLVNRCSVAIEVKEASMPSEPWIKVEPGQVSPFWPKAKIEGKPTELIVRLADTSEATIPFPYTRTLNCLLKINNKMRTSKGAPSHSPVFTISPDLPSYNKILDPLYLPSKYGAINVDVQMTEGAVYLTFTKYAPGMAPALIINHSLFSIPLAEKDATDNRLTLNAGHKVFFTWSTTKENHMLTWCEKYSNDLRKDEIGDFNVSPSVKLYWVTFLDGLQRVLLFTADPSIARDAEVAGEMEVFDQEYLISLHGIGLSLVDNFSHQEVLYVGITSSGTVWEVKKHGSRKFKSIPAEDSVKIEEVWNIYQQEITIGKQPNSKIAVSDNLVVDLATMELLRPHHRQLRRTYNQGLWVQLRLSPHQTQLHAKVNRLQIDNQNYDCVFPVVLAPVPPPKSVNMENAMKPFAEVSIVQRINEHSTVKQYKYYKALVQEFHIKVDIGFINALVTMFQDEARSDDQEAELFEQDLKLVDESLISHVELLSSQEQKNFYDILHFSPLKIHVSFSLSGGGVQAQTQLPPVLNVLMQSLGVTLTDIQDVVLKLSYFERTYTFLNQKQLLSEVQMHYRGQLIKQLYVLVLGLDVLGNPFGLVVGISEGVQDFFYEPFQGAIQGPGEFAEGLVLGVKSLFGHTVGGAAGAVSRITGAMGKGLAALTFDEDYQRKRREAMNYRPNNMQEGLAQSGKGLVMGVVEGVGGVFTKPISGAKEEGFEGFFKGVGKGMMGLVTRPTAGVIDFASGSFSAVKRAAEMGEEITRLRPPRYFNMDNLVRPYCKIEADGNKLLKELEKGKYYATDVYVYHTAIGQAKCRDILVLTDKRLLVLGHNDIFGGNQVEFTYVWGELAEPPVVVPRGVQIKIGEAKKKLFRGNDNTKIIFLENEDQKKFVMEKITKLMYLGTGTGSFSSRSGSRS